MPVCVHNNNDNQHVFQLIAFARCLFEVPKFNAQSQCVIMQARIKIRVVCARAYHALFMYNMLIRPTDQELLNFGKPDFTILNAGAFPVNRYTSYMSSSTSVDVSLK